VIYAPTYRLAYSVPRAGRRDRDKLMETPQAKLTHYVVDARASRFTVQAFANGILAAMGHNPKIGIRTFSGEVKFNPDTAEGSGFRLSMQANSFSVLDDVNDKDRREIERMMTEQVLEVPKFPEILYEASAVSIQRLDNTLFAATLNGNLSFHGVTNAQQVSARIAVLGEMLRASGEFTLRQSDYGIKPISVAGGALKVKDELKFSFEMVARKQA
jgi:polyisoprenoid-binding protein YceI